MNFPSKIIDWINHLNQDSAWQHSLNNAFDSIDFTDAEATRLATLFKANDEKIEIKDKIWGMVEIAPAVAPLLDTPLVQRLRYISQVGFTPKTYPTAEHSRFSHSVGVYHVIDKLLARFIRNAEDWNKTDLGYKPTRLSTYDETILRQAAILHDVGHTPFSHVTERYFSREKDRSRLGPYKITEVAQTFNKFIFGRAYAQAIDRLKLAEILTVIFLMSDRFRKYYYDTFASMRHRERDAVAEICCLVLGLKTSERNIALPTILSGPLDADKLDYMVRDADACGISLSLDISRIFLKAGLYEIEKVPEKFSTLPRNNILVFTLDRAGADTFFEFESARVSLYSRVYYHHLTRNAEKCYFEALRSYASEPIEQSATREDFSDVLSVWTKSDQVLLNELATCSRQESVRRHAFAIINRRLPKRASAFGQAYFRDLIPHWLTEHLDSATSRNIGQTVEELDSIAEDAQLEVAFLEKLRNEIEAIKVLLPDEFERTRNDAKECGMNIVGLGRNRIPSLGTAYIISHEGQLDRIGQRESSLFEGRLLDSSVGYIYCEPEWREAVAIATQNIVYQSLQRPYMARYSVHERDLDGSGSEVGDTEIRGIHQPVVDLEAVARRCKISWNRLSHLQNRLAEKGYYEGKELLVASEIGSAEAFELSSRFATFRGQGGWRANPHLLALFIQQFPVSLRRELISVLESIVVLDPKKIATSLFGIIGQLPFFGQEMLHVAPLTASSGTFVRSVFRPFIKDHPDWKLVTFHTTVEDAVTAANDGQHILLVDDNMASGSQSSKQVLALSGHLPAGESDPNLTHAALSEANREKMREKLITAFGFCVAHEDGIAVLRDRCSEVGWKLENAGVYFSEKLENITGVGKISEEMRVFLRRIGEELIRGKLVREGRDPSGKEVEEMCKSRALGYNNHEALLVTSFNVPTSTYTALWCPGTFREKESEVERPWLPLFLRNGMLNELVLP